MLNSIEICTATMKLPPLLDLLLPTSTLPTEVPSSMPVFIQAKDYNSVFLLILFINPVLILEQ